MNETTKRKQAASCRARNIVKSRGLVCSGDKRSREEIYRFVKSHQAEYPVTALCQTLNVSASGFYAWLVRKPSARQIANEVLGGRITHWWNKSRQTYGKPRIQADLHDENIYASDKRVAALIRGLNIQGASRRKGYTTTIRDHDARPAPDLVDREFAASKPNQLWVSDITYVPTLSGFLFLPIVLDVFSRRVVGWATATHLRTELVLDALEMALHQRRPENVIHHSDQGCQ